MSRVYTVALLREDEGGYCVLVPALPGCVSQGQSLAEALEHIKEAIEGYIEVLRERGKPVPEDSTTITFDLDDADEALVTKVTVGEAVPVA